MINRAVYKVTIFINIVVLSFTDIIDIIIDVFVVAIDVFKLRPM